MIVVTSICYFYSVYKVLEVTVNGKPVVLKLQCLDRPCNLRPTFPVKVHLNNLSN